MPADNPTALRKLRHDLRTPLGQIIGYSEILQEQLEERGLQDLLPDLARVHSAAHQLLNLVERIFEANPSGLPPSEAEAPRRERPAPADSEYTAADTTANSRGRILVVDDDDKNREMLARRLDRRGYLVTTAGDGVSALRSIERDPPDAVLLDVVMPEMDGFEVLRLIRRTRSPTELPVIMATGLDGSEDTVAALRAGANDYVTKPIDVAVAIARVEAHLRFKRAAAEIESQARRLEIQGSFIRNMFGRYVSQEVVTQLLETPAGLDLCGERRRVTILMSDLRGFSSFTQVREPTEVVALLNNYLGRMADIIQSYRGTIDEFVGDAILAFFGAPTSGEDDAERAVACALKMQLAIAEANGWNRSRGLPDIEMGIGIATGEVVVGNIGSEKRTKYGAVGSAINLAARVESQTVGGEIWIDAETRKALGDLAAVDNERTVQPKGFAKPLHVYRVCGIAGRHDLQLVGNAPELVALAAEVPVTFSLIEAKTISQSVRRGWLSALSPKGAELRSDDPLREMTDLCLEFADGCTPGAWYARVVSVSNRDGPRMTLRFTMRQGACAERLNQLLAANSDRAK